MRTTVRHHIRHKPKGGYTGVVRHQRDVHAGKHYGGTTVSPGISRSDPYEDAASDFDAESSKGLVFEGVVAEIALKHNLKGEDLKDYAEYVSVNTGVSKTHIYDYLVHRKRTALIDLKRKNMDTLGGMNKYPDYVYAEIVRKPYTYPLVVKRRTKEELLKDFPDAKIINEARCEARTSKKYQCSSCGSR
jgi:hypothetical protein